MPTGFTFEHFTRRGVVRCLVRPLVGSGSERFADALARLGHRACALRKASSYIGPQHSHSMKISSR
jgi:hypothetical protein